MMRLEHVVEVVRHAAGELADGLHLLRLGELRLQRPLLGGVERINDRDLAVLALVLYRGDEQAGGAGALAGQRDLDG